MSEECEFPRQNATAPEIAALLQNAHTIAVVGLSDKPERDSYRVAAYLQSRGYRIYPVNPTIEEVLGERAVARLEDISEHVDIVDIFRKPEAVPLVVDAALAIGAGAIWMQEGIVHNAAADKARSAGLQVVMNKCILKEHHALGRRSG